MDASWSSLGPNSISRFLQAANLDSLPEASALTENEWTILKGIIGEEAATRFRNSIGSGHNASAPALPIPKLTDFSDKIAELSAMDLELNTIMTEFMSGSITDNKVKMKETAAKRLKQLEEAQKKLAAADNAKSEPWWKRALKWVAAVVGLVVGVVAGVVSAPVTGGLGVAAAVLAAAAFTMFVLREAGAMDKLAEALAKHMETKHGWPPEKAKMFGMYFALGLEAAVTIASLVVNIANGVKMASAAKNLIDSANNLKGTVDSVSKTVSLTAAAGSKASEIMQNTLKATDILLKLETVKKLYVVSSLCSTGLQIYDSAIDIYAATLTRDAREFEANAAELKAFLQRMQNMLTEDSDRMKELIEKINSMLNGFSDIIDEIGDSHRSVIRHLNA